MSHYEPFSWQAALYPMFFFLAALIWALCVLCYPPAQHEISIVFPGHKKWRVRNPGRKGCVAVLAVLLWYAFKSHLDITPWYGISDTFGRFCYIWGAHMSNVIAIMEYEPQGIKDKLYFRERIVQAYEVLFSIRLESQEQRRRNCGHNYTRLQFSLRHTLKAVVFYALLSAWDYFNDHLRGEMDDYLTTSRYGDVYTYLDATWRVTDRLDAFMEWNVIALFLYEWIYSSFAAIFVGVLRLDSPQDWRMSLCGPCSEAWTVRGYWGKHWHSYIYLSFTAHTKIVTRQWLGLPRGWWVTRLAENTGVFALSGAGHAMVRWVQTPDGDRCAIFCWYLAQMIPIVLEQVVQYLWYWLRRELTIRPDNTCVNKSESMLGYLWTATWFMWSIPLYLDTREKWTTQKMWPKWEAEYRQYEERLRVRRERAWASQQELANVTVCDAKGPGYLISRDVCPVVYPSSD